MNLKYRIHSLRTQISTKLALLRTKWHERGYPSQDSPQTTYCPSPESDKSLRKNWLQAIGHRLSAISGLRLTKKEMTWGKLKYSKKEIKRAGETLAKINSTQEEKLIALEKLNNWRSIHALPMNRINGFLRFKASKIEKKVIVSQRLKRAPSIIKKLNRFKSMSLARMQDIGGCRAILSDTQKVYDLRESIFKSKIDHVLVNEKDYISNPKEDGYRGIHLIYKFQNKGNPEYDIYNGLLIEIQIRSRAQHAWATAVEIVDTFTKQNLKSNDGEEEWLSFFKITSQLFALEEKRKLSQETIDFIELGKLRRQATKLAIDLKILDRLKAFSVTSNFIKNQIEKWSYIILILDIDRQSINVEYFKKIHLNIATNRYTDLEQKI